MENIITQSTLISCVQRIFYGYKKYVELWDYVHRELLLIVKNLIQRISTCFFLVTFQMFFEIRKFLQVQIFLLSYV